MFNERQQIFTLRPTTKSAAESTRRLKEAFRKKVPVKAVLDSRRALIRKIGAPSPRELEQFQRLRTFLKKPARSRLLKVSSINHLTFNIVDSVLKWPAFELCRAIVPNYTTAKKIFDFCAQQSCHLPGLLNVNCIPFQYVRDGCYARAHKMQQIITTEFGYCCEKVFSFANAPLNEPRVRLAVRANKWGGCCVDWWYHVAPLIRVRFTLVRTRAVMALVIDPSMFDMLVPLSTWLAAQEDKGCLPHVKVRMYSIQPGSAYGPANWEGTMFVTDPSYALTDSTLADYRNYTTCS